MTDKPLATGPRQMALLAFDQVPEGTFPSAYVLVALWHQERLLLVHVRHRDCWELPGGGIDPGETPREAAVRELYEESEQRVAPDALRFVGYATTAIGPDQLVLRGAVFTAETTDPQPFLPNDEIAAVHWRETAEEPPGTARVQTVDTYLAALTRP
ncbi:NUDIX hydrolase [Streptomyces gobiensis]|uniref:NUDIX hydrolase n=1 Tax=Streptomyces gobiensis TaxID=2875706 RepID=UPI001E576FFD|nr:NUDIX domain-containing protein [Streptomyces gobiensis]UGY91535.1 NUDIX domain-containing protein [Streptomyces gobiensis]